MPRERVRRLGGNGLQDESEVMLNVKSVRLHFAAFGKTFCDKLPTANYEPGTEGSSTQVAHCRSCSASRSAPECGLGCEAKCKAPVVVKSN